MSYDHQPPSRHHNPRFYVVLITLVIGAIFIFLLMTDQKGLSGAIIGADSSNSVNVADKSLEEVKPIKSTSSNVGSSVGSKLEKSSSALSFNLAFDEVPRVKTTTEIESITFSFADTNSKISVNGDKLELSNLEQVDLNVQGYKGVVIFSDRGISLDGTATKIKVNSVALVSQGKIEISFEDLAYTTLGIQNLAVEELSLGAGDGNLKVGERLNYDLHDDGVVVNNFDGELLVDKNAEHQLTLNGKAEGLSINGEKLGLTIQ